MSALAPTILTKEPNPGPSYFPLAVEKVGGGPKAESYKSLPLTHLYSQPKK